MRKKPSKAPADELRSEYDSFLIRTGQRGKYAKRYKGGRNFVLLAPDVAAVFPDSKSVNKALRSLVKAKRKGNGESIR